ncbi:MAG: VWA domain-containing protein, partial [Gammaproteobacteria bacterium]|nr:VWA domain-containing protein [Gammaproteobacteria bacterium]
MQNKVAIPTYFYKKLKIGLFFNLSLLLMLPASASDSPLSVKPIDPSPVKNIKIKAITDLRVLVDISGSMKKTDPNNLRRPAIRLLAGLIPDDSRSGIWNFGKQVNMTVKIGAVNDAWRNAAREQSKEISSAGLYTNIENAMRKASFDWKEPDPKYKRNLILLTDGHVDISQDEKVDEASRKRILKEVLPLLEKAKVKIHTIALSDDVDENLLSTLSSYTDGLYRKVSSAEDLQKLFLQMLEQSVELDTLPIEDNRFNVDANINDMTLLVFNKDKEKPTSIVTPGKKTWSSKSQNDQIKWFSDDGYDLITIKKPQQGQCKIMAPVDENNRVVVATNLKLKINEL